MLKMEQTKVDRNGNESDLLACIIHIATPFRKFLDIKWVKGHQNERREKLSLEATLNVNADRLAGLALREAQLSPTVNLRGPEGIIVTMNGKALTNSFRRQVLESHSRPLLITKDNEPHKLDANHHGLDLLDGVERRIAVLWMPPTSHAHKTHKRASSSRPQDKPIGHKTIPTLPPV